MVRILLLLDGELLLRHGLVRFPEQNRARRISTIKRIQKVSDPGRAPDVATLHLRQAQLTTLEAMAPNWGRYPWSRAVYGTLLEGLTRQQPRAILFDILFVDPHKEHAQDDLYFIEVARKLPNVYFSMVRLQASADPQGIALKDVKAVSPTPRAKPEAARAFAPQRS